MNIHFSIRKQGKTDPVIILQAFDSRFPGRKFMYSTGHNIHASDWKKKKVGGFPKEKAELIPISEHLESLRAAVEEWVKLKFGSKTLDRQDLKDFLNRKKKDEQKENKEAALKEMENELFSVWQKIIDSSKNPTTGKVVKPGTKIQKQQTLNFVKQYCIDKSVSLSLLNIDLEFYHSFDAYMLAKSLQANTRGKHIKEIKSFLREALERNYDVNKSFQKKAFKVLKEDVDDTYLTIDDIKKFVALDIATPKRAELRAQIVTACFTGLRHSDWGQHDVRNIVKVDGKEMLKVKPKKTGQEIYIPIHPQVKIYLTQYGKLRNISNQKINEAIKEFSKAALKDKNEKPIKIILNGEEVEKWDFITSHSCRRSFCTNAYLSRTMPVHTIMKISGHKSEQSFLRYLKLGTMEHGLLAADSGFFIDVDWTNLKVVA